MTGGEVRSIRERYGLTVAQFAELIGVSTSTAYRWEHHDIEQNIEPFQQRIITVMRVCVDKDPSVTARVANGLASGGCLFGLYRLLETNFYRP